MNLKGHGREIVLGAVLLAALVYLVGPSLSNLGRPSSGSDVREPAVGNVLAVLDGPDVDLAMLTQQPGDYQGEGRNLFDYGRVVPPGPTAEELAAAKLAALRAAKEAEERRKREEAERERLRQEALKKQGEIAARRNSTPPAPPKPAKPNPPDFPFKFIGVIGPTEAKIAIFLDDKDFLMAQEGETVKEEFRIVKIGYDTLQIGYTDPLFEEDSSILQMGKDKK